MGSDVEMAWPQCLVLMLRYSIRRARKACILDSRENFFLIFNGRENAKDLENMLFFGKSNHSEEMNV